MHNKIPFILFFVLRIWSTMTLKKLVLDFINEKYLVAHFKHKIIHLLNKRKIQKEHFSTRNKNYFFF